MLIQEKDPTIYKLFIRLMTIGLTSLNYRVFSKPLGQHVTMVGYNFSFTLKVSSAVMNLVPLILYSLRPKMHGV